jgi:putative nucleotidyltransferase with HDIG domain
MQMNNNITFEEAKRFVEGLGNPGDSWLRHSFKVAEASGRIADALVSAGVELDVEFVRIAALFHDAGRSEGHGYLHGWAGFEILKKAGLEKYARQSVTHWLKGRSIKAVLSESVNLDEKFIKEIFEESRAGDFELSDKIISLADSITKFDEFSTVEERYGEARLRYGDSLWLRTNEKISHEIKKEFDALIGRNIYDLFPEISGKGGAIK